MKTKNRLPHFSLGGAAVPSSIIGLLRSLQCRLSAVKRKIKKPINSDTLS
jgi:hypothetical protein